MLKARAFEGAPEGLVVQAARQTQARGRHGRHWVSAPGNLHFSFLLRPAVSAEYIGIVSLMTGLATGRAIDRLLPETERLVLKWPNDILLAGKKCAGILLETEIKEGKDIEFLCIGIGVNLVWAPPEAACLSDYIDPLPPDAFLEQILYEFKIVYTSFLNNNFNKIREAWLSMSVERGTAISVKKTGHVEKGRFYDIDGHGALLMERSTGAIQKITVGDIYFD